MSAEPKDDELSPDDEINTSICDRNCFILVEIMAGDCGGSGTKFEFPECWGNDVRMSALFAPFRSKSVNPTDWDSKMKFWTNVIENWCKFNKCPVIDICTLKNCFSRKGLLPACLEDVVQYLHSTGILVSKDSFVMPDENWKSWAIKVLVTNPLKWTYNTVKSTLIKADEKEIHYVHTSVVKYLSEELLKSVPPSSRGKIVSFEELMKLGFESPDSLSVVLHWMGKQRQAALCNSNGVTLVKLTRTAKEPVKITETDLGIYSLQEHEKVLEENIRKLYADRSAALEKTKKHLADKMKDLARISLLRKKEIEKIIEKRSVALENIQAILQKIEQVKLDSEVVDSYQKGITALKQIYKDTGLNVETVSNTMEELAEVLNGRSELEEALARPLDPALEESLEDELNELLLDDLPDAPKDQLPAEGKNSKSTDKITKQLQALAI